MSRVDEIQERWLEFEGRRRGRSDVRYLLDCFALAEKALKEADRLVGLLEETGEACILLDYRAAREELQRALAGQASP